MDSTTRKIPLQGMNIMRHVHEVRQYGVTFRVITAYTGQFTQENDAITMITVWYKHNKKVTPPISK